MITYNVIIIDGKIINPYLNLTQQAFFDKLWEWTFVDDLWDYIEEDPEYLSNRDNLKDWLYGSFIPEWVLHQYDEDEISCFAFTTDLENTEYIVDEDLVDFILDKIDHHTQKNFK